MFGEEEGSKQEIRWPSMIREIDHDFCAVFDKDKPSKLSTNTSNMVETGKLLKMLNQTAFMVKASNVVMKDLGNNLQNEEAKGSMEVLKGFLEISENMVDQMINVTTNMQLNNLVRREEVLKQNKGANKLSIHEKNVLRFAPPKDNNERLFSGKLQEFKDRKAQRDQVTVINQVLQEKVYKRKGCKEEYPTTNSYKRARDSTSDKIRDFHHHNYKKSNKFQKKGRLQKNKDTTFQKGQSRMQDIKKDKYNKDY